MRCHLDGRSRLNETKELLMTSRNKHLHIAPTLFAPCFLRHIIIPIPLLPFPLLQLSGSCSKIEFLKNNIPASDHGHFHFIHGLHHHNQRFDIFLILGDTLPHQGHPMSFHYVKPFRTQLRANGCRQPASLLLCL